MRSGKRGGCAYPTLRGYEADRKERKLMGWMCVAMMGWAGDESRRVRAY
jgi:hypothetical protein